MESLAKGTSCRSRLTHNNINNMKKGFIGIILIIIAGVFFGLVISFLVLDFNRFSKVNDAKTPDEISKACQEYKMSTLESIPQRCFPYIESFNVKRDERKIPSGESSKNRECRCKCTDVINKSQTWL